MKQENLNNVKLEQELNDDELEQAAGGMSGNNGVPDSVDMLKPQGIA